MIATTKPKPRIWRPTVIRPQPATVAKATCGSCQGRGIYEVPIGHQKTGGLPCPICQATGKVR